MKINSVLLLFTLAFFSCSIPTDSQSRRGGGLEIPNGIQATLVLRLTDSSGTPLGNAPVQIVAGESWADRISAGKNVVLSQDTTDSAGFLKVELTESREFLLARVGNSGIHIPLHVRDSLGNGRFNPMPIPLRGLAKLRLAVSGQKQLALFGMPWSGASSTGNLVIDSLPSGEYMAVALDKAGLQMGSTLETNPFDTATDAKSVVFSDPNNLMLTNFENRRLLGIWDPMHVGGYWWATARCNDSASWEHVGLHVLSDLLDSADGNTFLRYNVNFKDSGETVANVGLDFSTEPVNTNLSKASAVRFLAKGTGTWDVYIQTQNVDGSNALRWKTSVVLSGEWKEYRIPMESFVCENNPSIAWDKGVRLGTNLFWQTNENQTLQLDDVVLEGLRFEDWVDP